MLKFLAVLAMFLAVGQAAMPVPWQTADNPGRTSQSVKSDAQGNQSPAVSKVAIKTPPSPNPAENHGQSETFQNKEQTVTISKIAPVDVNKNNWDYAYIVLTGTLAVVGIFTLVAIWYQAIQTRKAADAALLNAKALIASERPWLVVLPEAVDPGSEELPHLYRLRATNIGNTPAQLFDGGMGCGQQTVEPVFVPAEDDLGPFILPLENLTVHGDYFDIQTIHGKDGEYGMIPKMFHVYGRIRYWDTFSDRTKVKPYVTQWCFMYDWHRQAFHRTPGDYNQNT